MGCTNYDSPCKSLDYVINISQSGDTIKLIADQLNSSCFEHCMVQPMTKSLTIQGEGNLTSLCCIKTLFKGYESPLLYAENTSLTLEHVTVRSSHILATNSSETCTFENSVLFLMQEEFYSYYSDPNVSFIGLGHNAEIGYSYWLPGEAWKEFTETTPLTCFLSSALLHNEQWTSQRNDIPLRIDASNQLVIQAICLDIYIYLTSSSMADNPIFIISVINLDVHIYDTTFEGNEQGNVAQGVLQVNSFCFPKMFVKNCTFSHLKYNDIGFSHMADLLEYPAAVMITILESSIIRECEVFNAWPIVSTHPIDIQDSVFNSCFRGVHVKSEVVLGTFYVADILDIVNLRIKMSQFLNNQVVDDGAAIFIDFENIGVGLTVTGFAIGLHVPSVHGYEKLSENSIKLYLETIDMSSTSSINESVNLDIRGSGGAIYVNSAFNVIISDCSFVNNTANYYDGAIYTGFNAHLALQRTRFTSAMVSPAMTSDILLQSSGPLRVMNCSFILLVTVLKNISIFYHSREGIRYSIVIQNITISCPKNSRLKIFNTTIDIEKLSSPFFSQ